MTDQALGAEVEKVVHRYFGSNNYIVDHLPVDILQAIKPVIEAENKKLRAEIEKLVRVVGGHVAVRKTYYDENQKLRAVLKDVEHGCYTFYEDNGGIEEYSCPSCGMAQPSHYDDCRLKAALRREDDE